MNFLYQFDIWLLQEINRTWNDPSLDQLWLQLSHLQRQQWFYMLVVPALLLWLLYIYRGQIVKPLIGVGLAVAGADLLSYRVIKALVQRPRPFENPEVQGWLRKVGDAHGPSFPSNHAANCFAAAIVLSWFFPRQAKYFYIFATLIALSRVTLGVHYPLDVAAGAMLGLVVGFIVRSSVLNRFNWFYLRDHGSSKDENSPSWRTRFGQDSDS